MAYTGEGHLKYQRQATEINLKREKLSEWLKKRAAEDFAPIAREHIQGLIDIGDNLRAVRNSMAGTRGMFARWSDEVLDRSDIWVRAMIKISEGQGEEWLKHLEEDPTAIFSLKLTKLAWGSADDEKEPKEKKTKAAGRAHFAQNIGEVADRARRLGFVSRKLEGEGLPQLWVCDPKHTITGFFYVKCGEDEYEEHRSMTVAEQSWMKSCGGDIGDGVWDCVFSADQIEERLKGLA